MPPALLQLTSNPSTLNSGHKTTAKVFLEGLAPAGGAVVTLASSNTGVADVPPSVTIPQGGLGPLCDDRAAGKLSGFNRINSLEDAERQVFSQGAPRACPTAVR